MFREEEGGDGKQRGRKMKDDPWERRHVLSER